MMIRLTPAWQANLEAAATRGSGLEHTHDSGGRNDDPRRMAASNDSLTLTLATPAVRYGSNTFTLFRCRLSYHHLLWCVDHVPSISLPLPCLSNHQHTSPRLHLTSSHSISLHLTSPFLPVASSTDSTFLPTPHDTLSANLTRLWADEQPT